MSLRITACRDSICGVDDVLAPNQKEIVCDNTDRISDLLHRLADFVPDIKDKLWAVYCCDRMIGYIEIGTTGDITYKVCAGDMVGSLEEKKVFCKLYKSRRGFHQRYNDDGTARPRLSKAEIKERARETNRPKRK